MNKDNFQKELLERVKKGIKPSDLKKQGKVPTPASTPPSSPIITPIDKKISKKPSKSNDLPTPIVYNKDDNKSEQLEQKKLKELENQVKFWSTTASNHLSSLQKAIAENDSLKLELAELKNNPAQLNKEIEQALKEANQKIRDQEQTISDLDYLLKSGKNSEIIKGLQTENKNLNKTIEKLKKQTKNTEEIKEKEPKYYLFTCDICEQNKRSKLHREKVNGLGIDPNKINKICDGCINRVDIIKNTEQEYIWE